MSKTWQPLADVHVSEPDHNPDVIAAVELVRDAVARLPLPGLDRESVLVDVSPKLRAAHFRFQHTGRPDVVVEIGHGDGYTWWRAPTGRYDGFVQDDKLAAFVEGKLIEAFGPRDGAA